MIYFLFSILNIVPSKMIILFLHKCLNFYMLLQEPHIYLLTFRDVLIVKIRLSYLMIIIKYQVLYCNFLNLCILCQHYNKRLNICYLLIQLLLKNKQMLYQVGLKSLNSLLYKSICSIVTKNQNHKLLKCDLLKFIKYPSSF